jgi:hypothetical protein
VPNAENNRTEICARAKQERIWLARLRALPNGVFDLVVRRITKGDSIFSIAKYLCTVAPEYSVASYRKYLTILADDIRTMVEQKQKANREQNEIDEFNQAKQHATVVEPPPEPESPSTKPLSAIRCTVNRAIRDLQSEDLLKYTWITQQKRVDEMVLLEQRMGFKFPWGDRAIAELRKIAEAIFKHEIGTALLLRKGAGVPTSIDIDKLSPTAQEFAKLDDVDRNLVRQLGHRFQEFVEEGLREHRAAAEGSGTDPGSRKPQQQN